MSGENMPAITTAVNERLEEAVRARLAGWPAEWEGYHWPGYCYEHTLRVRALALHLARIEGADEDVVHVAATLHDICKSAGAEHAGLGAAEARQLLLDLAADPDVRERACDAIASHCGDNTQSSPLESRVLGDADLIDANFGLVAVARFITIRSGHNTPLPETIRSLSEWLPRKDAFLEVLLTSSGRQVARQRSARMHVFCDELLLSLQDPAATEGVTLFGLAGAIHRDRGRSPLGELVDTLGWQSGDVPDDPLVGAALRSLASEIAGLA
jgi:uncharacterized protein